jgi:hypothetical protein
MKDFTKSDLEDKRPETKAEHTISYCLNRLYDDTQHTVAQEVVHRLTFEELIGTLLQARDLYEQMQEMKEYDEEDTGPSSSAGLSQL